MVSKTSSRGLKKMHVYRIVISLFNAGFSMYSRNSVYSYSSTIYHKKTSFMCNWRKVSLVLFRETISSIKLNHLQAKNREKKSFLHIVFLSTQEKMSQSLNLCSSPEKYKIKERKNKTLSIYGQELSTLTFD